RIGPVWSEETVAVERLEVSSSAPRASCASPSCPQRGGGGTAARKSAARVTSFAALRNSPGGNAQNLRLQRAAQGTSRKLAYPPNSSSPPVPARATVRPASRTAWLTK